MRWTYPIWPESLVVVFAQKVLRTDRKVTPEHSKQLRSRNFCRHKMEQGLGWVRLHTMGFTRRHGEAKPVSGRQERVWGNTLICLQGLGYGCL